jgi:hypothetical protein
MYMIRMFAGVLLAAALSACGGGGGSPGGTTAGGGGTGSGGGTPTPAVALQLVDASGQPTATIANSPVSYARATVRDANGAVVVGTVVTFTSDGSLVRFVPASGTALTDGSGVASVQVLPADSASAGAGLLKADASVAGTPAKSGSVSFQVPQGSAADPATAKVANFVLLLDRSTLVNSGTATAKLTAIAVDANNNVVPGAVVSVSSDSNSVFTPGSKTTDSSGQFTGQIGIGGDKSNRQVLVTAVINGLTKQTSLLVTGTQLKIQASPAAPSPGQSATVTVTAVDGASNPIANVPVTLGGTIPSLQGVKLVTGLNGTASMAFAAPVNAGVYNVNASGYGVSSGDYQVQVFSTAVPAAVLPTGSTALPSLAAAPNVLATNAPNSTTNRSTLRFLFLDQTNTPIKNVRVRFDDVTTGLPAVGASISSGTSALYTDASGTVTTQYIAGQNPSPTNGVQVQACWSLTDFAATYQPADCPASNKVTVTLTVAGQALAVSIGDDNLLSKGAGTYIKRFAVTVADSAGRAVANAPVDISVDLTHYGKGSYGYASADPANPAPYFFKDAAGNRVQPEAVVPPNVPPQSYPQLAGAASPRYSIAPTDQRVWCANEDLNRNGNVDAGENLDGSVDSNSQPTLEPRKSDLIVSYDDPNVTTTNASGILVIKVEYSQRFATWLAYKVRVTASVSGSQGMAERLFVTSFVTGDDSNGSFLSPPYGFNACQTAN